MGLVSPERSQCFYSVSLTFTRATPPPKSMQHIERSFPPLTLCFAHMEVEPFRPSKTIVPDFFQTMHVRMIDHN